MIVFKCIPVFFTAVLLLDVVVCREPLINDNGRFKFVDNVQTVTVNQSAYHDALRNQLVRRDTDGFSYCRGRCSGTAAREQAALRKRSLQSEGFILSAWRSVKRYLQKRAFQPQSFTQFNQKEMDTWMVEQFNNDKLIYVFDPTLPEGEYNGILRDENTARFSTLGNAVVNMGVEYLCGCTILVIVSTEAVYFAHFFESLSFSPDKGIQKERRNPSLEKNFQQSVIDFLSTGKDWPTGEVRENVKLAELASSFTSDLGARAFILTPQNQKDAAEDDGAEADGKVVYIEGLLYKDLVDELIKAVQNMLPGVSVTPFVYQALDGKNKDLDTTGRGKALFQYDPQARTRSGGRRGARLIFEGVTIRITEPRRMTFPKGVVYEHYWNPTDNAVNEDRLLSDSESQDSSSAHQGSSLSCAGQMYQSSDYTCYGDSLCPVLDGIQTLLCGTQCYLESRYTCYDSFLCPVLDGVPTLRCGMDCYLPSQYKCESSHLVQLPPPDDDSHQSASPTSTMSPLPSSPVSRGTEVVFNGTVYTIISQSTTLISDGTVIILGPSGLTIGSDTIPLPTQTETPITITTDGVTFTVGPPGHHTSSSSSIVPSSTAAPGPSPTSVIPRPTTSPTSSQVPSSTVITITAIEGSSTTEVTFTASTLTPFTTLTGTSSLITTIDGVSTTVIVGPGGIAWIPTHPSTVTSGFPPVPFPSRPPSPGSTGTGSLPTETSSPTSRVSTKTYNPFPSSRFTVPPVITATITTEGPDGPTTEIITGTADSTGFVRPVTTMSTPAAIASAKSLSSRIVSASGVIAAFSLNPTNAASASSAVAAIETAKASGNGFGIGLGISLPGLCFLFCGSASNAVTTLEDLLIAISDIEGGSFQPASLTGPLTELANIATELGEEADSADPNSVTATSADCTGTVLTNCNVFCVATTAPGGTQPTSSCYSTSCSVETECGGSAVTSTSYDHLYCPLSYGEETISLYSYPGFTLDPVITDSGDDFSSTTTPASTDITTTSIPTTTEAPSASQSTTIPTTTTSLSTTSTLSTTVTQSSVTTTTSSTTTTHSTKTSSPSPSPTQPAKDYVSNCYSYTYELPSDTMTCASFAKRYGITAQQLFDWNYSLQPSDGSKTCDMHTAWSRGTRTFCIGVRESSTTSSTSSTAAPAPPLTKCSTYKDCPACPQGEWRCCFQGCNGMLVPGSNHCACFKNGSTPGASCGCT